MLNFLIVYCSGIAILFFEKVLLVISTAFAGSYGFFFGVDVFANTGFSNGIQTFLSGGDGYVATTAVYGMLSGVFVLAVLGAIYQFRDKNRKSLSSRSAEPSKPGKGYEGVAVAKF
jgi:hypothetical protein